MNFDGFDLLFLLCVVWIGWWAVTGVKRSIAAEREDEWLRTADYERERRRRAEDQAAEIVRFAERGK